MEEAQCIAILAAGDFPIFRVPVQVLREASFVICCDSAYEGFRDSEFRGKDFAVVGDGDSLSLPVREGLGERYVFDSDQETNDLTKAMRYGVERFGVERAEYVVLGATGRREDHTLANISLLARYAEEYPGIRLRMLTDYGTFTAMTGCRRFESVPGQQVSVFTLTPEVGVSSEGLRWALNGRRLAEWWQGSLNEAVGDSFSVSGGSILVFQSYLPKV